MHVLQDSVAERSEEYLCFSNGRVQDLRLWAILLGHDESGPMLGLKSLVGPRWREFHCLRRRGPPKGRGRRGAGMKFSQRILYFEFYEKGFHVNIYVCQSVQPCKHIGASRVRKRPG